MDIFHKNKKSFSKCNFAKYVLEHNHNIEFDTEKELIIMNKQKINKFRLERISRL